MEFTDEAFEEEISYSVLIPLDEWIKTTVNGETYTQTANLYRKEHTFLEQPGCDENREVKGVKARITFGIRLYGDLEEKCESPEKEEVQKEDCSSEDNAPDFGESFIETHDREEVDQLIEKVEEMEDKEGQNKVKLL